ncbi:MAG: toxin-antitoxin system YwqK family antitoxin [Fibrobacteria bacterium]|nr:toxin-antitoxin system YwqK family antitoxin [Fibrobacteria bacterium]
MIKIITLSTLFFVFLLGCEKIAEKKKYYPNGKLKEQWEVTKDEYGQEIKNGLYKAWFDNGQIHHEINYLDDKKHGVQRSYYKNGKQELEENYLFGKLSGKKKTWTIDGKPELEMDYVDGKKHGLDKRYRENGKIHHEISYKNGLKDGTHKFFDSEGKLDKTQWYKDGNITDQPADSTLAAEAAPAKADSGKATDSAKTAE